MVQLSPAILPYLASHIPYRSGSDTLHFTCSVVLIVLALRLTKITIKKLGFSADFKLKN
jgi:hypothetical protein